jgi:transposase
MDRAESSRLDCPEERSRCPPRDGLACSQKARLPPSSATPFKQAAGNGGGASRVQKKLELAVASLHKAHPAEEIEAWCEDEARFGLKPILRRVWSPIGERPLAEVDARYEWLWLYAAVQPQTGRTFWLVLPRLDSDCVQLFLGEFAKEHAPEGKHIVLVWDGAPAHRATGLQVPERITLLSLPAYTPELNPGERVWPLVKEGVANKAHDTLNELEQQVCSRCQKISAEEISALTNYHWWPKQ